MSMIYAGIVTYNPNIELLKQNIEAIRAQVNSVLISDNGSKNFTEIRKIADDYNIEIINNRSNLGIASALNKLMQWGLDNAYEWMISLDQDSVCDSTYVLSMKPYLSVEADIGIVAPVIEDRSIGVVGHNPSDTYDHVNTCITSGAFTKIDVWDEVGGYDESMFIDSVDFEFCFRVRKAGFSVIQVSSVHLMHRIGNSKKRRFLFWKIDVQGHSAFRKYYISRNNVYYPLKHHLWIRFVRGNLRNIRLLLIVLLYEDDKRNKISAIMRGWKAAFRKLNSSKINT